MVANLPYNITKLAMRKLLPLGDNLSHLYLMLQVRPPPLLFVLAHDQIRASRLCRMCSLSCLIESSYRPQMFYSEDM